MTTPLQLLPMTALAPMLRDRRISSETLTRACLDRIAVDNGRFNAFTQVFEEEALAQARDADREIAHGHWRGPLHGMPISLKDILDLRGTPTTAASRVREGHCAAADAPVVSRLRQAGAVFVGKCNLHEFAFGTTSEDSAFGPVRNPRDPARSAGGSSGGSAAAVVAGMSVASIGTDTGGSVRIPAAACGTVGLKPAHGELPLDGIVPLNRSLDHVGPLGRTVTDAWLVYRALRGDERTDLELDPSPSLRTLQIGVPRPYFLDLLDDEVRRRFDESLARLRAAGATIRDVTIPHATDIAPIYLHIGLPEAGAYHADTLDRVPDRYTPSVRIRLELGRYLLAEDYVRARDGQRLLRSEVEGALDGVDALALPTLTIPAPPLGVESVVIGTATVPVRNAMLRLTQLFNLTGHPAISLPCGATADGLPCGLQLAGPIHQTDTLLRVARTVEMGLS